MTPHHSRKDFFNEGYFSEILREDQAWMLGWLATDGNVCKTCVQFHLAEKDRDVLETFRRLVGSTGQIIDCQDRGHQMVHWQVHSSTTVADLARHGIHPKKTWTVKPWVAPNAELQRHYWRGVIEGDGTICGSSAGRWQVSLVGNRSMVDGFSDFVRSAIAARATVRPKNNIFQVSYGGNHLARDVVRLLYNNATHFLNRKKAKADELCSLSLPKIARYKNDGITKKMMVEARARAGSWDGAARSLGVHIATFSGRVTRLGLR